MYLPIPEAVNMTHSVTVYAPGTPCYVASSETATASFSIPKSTVALKKMNDTIHYVTDRPTEGSWRQVKKNGSIKMTPMEIINERATFPVGQVQMPFIQWKAVNAGNPNPYKGGRCYPCGGVVSKDCKAAIVKGSYVEQGDLNYWKSKYPNAPHYVLRGVELDQNKVEAAKGEAYAELFQAFNLGEELAELRETITGIMKLFHEGINLILRYRAMIASLLKRDALTEAGSRWMEFRYGIMPIMYSIQDLLSLQTEGKYRTTRRTVSPEVEMPEEIDDKSVYFQDIGMVDVRCFITAKARWATQALKTLDLININPITTTTAILPWSMVVRWFFNVQSYLDVRVKSLTNLSLENRACVAIREKREYGTYLHLTTGYPSTRVYHPGNSACGQGFYGVTEFGTYEDLRTQHVLLAQYSVNNYKRYLYQPADVKLVFNPYISWQRSIDAFVLMMGSMSKLLRRLK